MRERLLAEQAEALAVAQCGRLEELHVRGEYMVHRLEDEVTALSMGG